MQLATLLIPDALASSIVGPMDVMASAAFLDGKHWPVARIARNMAPVTCFNGVMMMPTASFHDETIYDLILIPSLILGPQGLLHPYSDVLEWLRRQYQAGAALAAICTGNFLLASTGLLNGFEATTHWRFASLFQQKFPKVKLDAEKTLIKQGRLMSCSAGSAWHDLVVDIVRHYLSDRVALEMMQLFQLQLHNQGQTPATGLLTPVLSDRIVGKAMEDIRQNHAEQDCLEKVIEASGLNTRTFQRRFRSLTGVAAINYLQAVRVEKAKELLMFTHEPVDVISYRVGYEDASYLRRLFRRETGMSPGEYRKRFQEK